MKFNYHNAIGRIKAAYITNFQFHCIELIGAAKRAQAKAGYVGTSTAAAAKIGRDIISGGASLCSQYIRDIDDLLTTGGPDIPYDALDQLAESFSHLMRSFEHQPVKWAEDYMRLYGMENQGVLGRIKHAAVGSALRLESDFTLMLRKHQGSATAHFGVEIMVQKLNFRALGGEQFERLVAAYGTTLGYPTVQWRGEAGSDAGRDVLCVDPATRKMMVFLCANYATLTIKKAKSDLAKLKRKKDERLERLVVICAGKIGNKCRDDTIAEAANLGFTNCECWTGAEFEERLRRDNPDLIERFFQGVPFPSSQRRKP